MKNVQIRKWNRKKHKEAKEQESKEIIKITNSRSVKKLLNKMNENEKSNLMIEKKKWCIILWF